MEKLNSVVGFSSFLLVLLIVLVIFLLFYERKKKRELVQKFKRFSSNKPEASQNSRTVTRIRVPDSMEVVLDLVGENIKKTKAFALDLSLNGFSASVHFPSKRISPDMVFRNIRVTTPINRFSIKQLRLVRIEKRVTKILLAFHIKEIDEDQFDSLKVFLKYLDEFLSQKDDQRN